MVDLFSLNADIYSPTLGQAIHINKFILFDANHSVLQWWLYYSLPTYESSLFCFWDWLDRLVWLDSEKTFWFGILYGSTFCRHILYTSEHFGSLTLACYRYIPSLVLACMAGLLLLMLPVVPVLPLLQHGWTVFSTTIPAHSSLHLPSSLFLGSSTYLVHALTLCVFYVGVCFLCILFILPG